MINIIDILKEFFKENSIKIKLEDGSNESHYINYLFDVEYKNEKFFLDIVNDSVLRVRKSGSGGWRGRAEFKFADPRFFQKVLNKMDNLL